VFACGGFYIGPYVPHTPRTGVILTAIWTTDHLNDNDVILTVTLNGVVVSFLCAFVDGRGLLVGCHRGLAFDRIAYSCYAQ
jgi:hypothetical protein